MSNKATTLIAGLGSAHGDDQAGWLTAGLLCGMCRGNHNVAVRRALVPLDVLDWLDGIDVLYLCDACEWNSRPGQILQFRWNAGRLVDSDTSGDHRHPVAAVPFRSRGSHDFSLPEMLRLAEEMQTLQGGFPSGPSPDHSFIRVPPCPKRPAVWPCRLRQRS